MLLPHGKDSPRDRVLQAMCSNTPCPRGLTRAFKVTGIEKTVCRGTSHFQMALKLSTSHRSTRVSHPFFLPYAEKRLLAATLIGA